jgi:membrane protein
MSGTKWEAALAQRRTGWMRIPSTISRTLLLAVRSFIHDQCLFRASALTYITVLSLVPLLALGFAVAKGFGFYASLLDESIGPFLDRTFGPLQEAAPIVQEAGAHEMRVAIEQVLRFVERTDVSALGLFGLVLLLYTVVRLLSAIEGSFNDIWRISRPRSFVRKVADYLTMVVITPIFLFTATGITTALSNSTLVTYLREQAHMGMLLEVLLKCTPLFALWMGFTFVYMALPNTRVRFQHAFVGALVAGTLWQVVLLVHILFQIGIAKHNAIYSSFAALPIFLMWVNISWTTVLFGAEIARAREIEPSWGGPMGGTKTASARRSVGLRAMVRLADDHLSGAPPRSAAALGAQLSVDPSLVEEVLRRCQARGLARESVEGSQRTWLLGRDAGTVRLQDIADAIDEREAGTYAASDLLDAELTRLVTALEREQSDSAYNRTLRTVVEAVRAHEGYSYLAAEPALSRASAT